MVGGGKDGFDEASWLKAFEYVSSGGNLDMGKCEKLIAMAGLDLKPKEFDEFKNIADYNSDGKVDMADFVSMIHATI